jgi:hypothetical protein
VTSRLANEIPLAGVLLGCAVGLGFVTVNRWRLGMLVVGLAFLAGGLLRLVLPARRAGLLAVRGRGFDVLVLGALGGAMLLLSAAVPPP